MENREKTMAEMTKLHFSEHPEESIASVDEYLEEGLTKDTERQQLKEKFKSSGYYEQFRTAILHTSFIITAIFQKTTNPELELNLDKFFREFFAFAQKDDKDIYKMRLYYLTNLNADTLGIGYVNPEDIDELEEQIEKDLVLKHSETIKKTYNKSLNDITKQYMESKLHLA